MINFLADITIDNSLPTIMYNIGGFLTIFILVFLTLLIARYRSAWASIGFIPFIVTTFVFIYTKVGAVSDFFASGNTFFAGVLTGIMTIYNVVSCFHSALIYFLALIAPTNQGYLSVVSSDIFQLVFSIVMFLLLFGIFDKNRKRRKAKYNDDF